MFNWLVLFLLEYKDSQKKQNLLKGYFWYVLPTVRINRSNMTEIKIHVLAAIMAICLKARQIRTL